MEFSAGHCISGTITGSRWGRAVPQSRSMSPGIDIVSVIRSGPAEELKLTVGGRAFAVIKVGNGMVGVVHR